MFTDKARSAGGKASAIIQKQLTKERIDEHNKNPNLCLNCGKPIFATYDKKLRETKSKKFCNRSCSARYNNIGKIKNINGINNVNSFIDNFSDDEIIEIFNSSNSITDFSKKLGYKTKINIENKCINERLSKLNLKLEDIKNQISTSDLTKQELFNRYKQWQTARSIIQKNARDIYNKSNKPKECIVCKYNKHYEVAHIKAVSDFDGDATISEINCINNLIALCPNHHWEYDNTDFDISDYLIMY